MKATLLIEIGVEELPPKAMRRLADAFAHGLGRALGDVGLAHGGVTRFATPRRLAVTIADLPDRAAANAVEKAGPTVAIAFDADGVPTAAAQGFARSVGTTVDALAHEDSDKGERLVYRATEPGKPLVDLLQPAVDAVLDGLPIPKRMRWGHSEAAFVRPVHWLVALHGDQIVDVQVFGESAGRTTYGHRFHHPGMIELHQAEDYEAYLEDPGYVVTDPDRRKQRIVAQVEAAAFNRGGHALIDDALAEEVSALVEWPVGVAGGFEAGFLVLPREVLISTLQDHQRYFPIENEQGQLMPGFVTVANIESTDEAQVIAGNERVVRPRLADALFFWSQDRRHGLAAHVSGLARVSFQKELGSLADKTERVREIAARIASTQATDPQAVDRAATLAKTDLLTEMVGEFPELQGIMGRYYALDAGESSAVAEAIAEQYAPTGAGAAIAQTAAGRVLAIADRLDTLAGIFAINRRPSGDKDPFALRRAALGVLRTLIEGDIGIDLRATLEHAVSLQPVTAATDTVGALWMFHMERLRGYCAERGIAGDRFDAVAQTAVADMTEFQARLQAVTAFVLLPDARTVCDAHKRIRNILRRNASEATTDRFDETQAAEHAERQLGDALLRQSAFVESAMSERRYNQALADLVDLARPLDRFFDEVMVMSDDPVLRHNRIALLAELDRLCRRVADISFLSLE